MSASYEHKNHAAPAKIKSAGEQQPSNSNFQFSDNRPQSSVIRQTQDLANGFVSDNAGSLQLKSVSIIDSPAVIQMKLGGGDKVSLNALKKGMSDNPEENWVILDKWVRSRGNGKKDGPTIEEAAEYLDVKIKQPELKKEEETSDIKDVYDVKKGCALQALINYLGPVLEQKTPEALHYHIWSTPTLEKFRNYDVDWEKFYAHIGIVMTKSLATTKAKDVPDGKFLVEVKGHMMVIEKAKKSDPFLIQDSGNSIGKLSDEILQNYP